MSLVPTISYVENQIEMKEHHNYQFHNNYGFERAGFFCDNAYCDTFDQPGQQHLWGNRVESISHEQCMDMCLCDDSCEFYVFGTYTCYDGSMESVDLSGQPPQNLHPCSMCRLHKDPNQMSWSVLNYPEFQMYNASNRYYPALQGDPANVFVGTKSYTDIQHRHNREIHNYEKGCVDKATCDIPTLFSGSSALDTVGESTCDCIGFDDCGG